MIYIASIS